MSKVNVSWAYTRNEWEKGKENREYYEKIKDKAKIISKSSGYAHCVVVVEVKEGFELSHAEIALIADEGNLCFGYRDFTRLRDNKFRVTINTN